MSSKVFSTYSADSVKQIQKTDSGKHPGQTDALYFDSETEQEITAPNGADLLEVMDSKGLELTNKADFIKAGRKSVTGYALRESGDKEYDVVHFDLSNQADPAAARKVIIEALKAPDLAGKDEDGKDKAYTKNQGGGRTQTIEFAGNRTVFAWGLHTDQQAGPHFQAFIHTYALKDGKVSARLSFKDAGPRSLFEKQINKALAKNGMQPISIGGPGPTSKEDLGGQATPAQRLEVLTAIEKGEVPPIPSPESMSELTLSAKLDALRKAGVNASKEAENLHREASEAANRAFVYSQAMEALTRAEDLARKLAAEREAKAKAEAEAKSMAEGLEKVTSKLDETIDHASTLSEKLEAQTAVAAEAVADAATEKEAHADTQKALTAEQQAKAALAAELVARTKERDDARQLTIDETRRANEAREKAAAEEEARKTAEQKARAEEEARKKAEKKAEDEKKAREELAASTAEKIKTLRTALKSTETKRSKELDHVFNLIDLYEKGEKLPESKAAGELLENAPPALLDLDKSIRKLADKRTQEAEEIKKLREALDAEKKARDSDRKQATEVIKDLRAKLAKTENKPAPKGQSPGKK